jgi:hypothetical protein
VQDEAGVGSEPALDFRGLTAGGVVQDEAHADLGGDRLFDAFEELEGVEGAVALVQAVQHLAGLDVQGA